MSRMHHRRAGYPFGSLVDFAPDSMGRKLLIFMLVFLLPTAYMWIRRQQWDADYLFLIIIFKCRSNLFIFTIGHTHSESVGRFKVYSCCAGLMRVVLAFNFLPSPVVLYHFSTLTVILTVDTRMEWAIQRKGNNFWWCFPTPFWTTGACQTQWVYFFHCLEMYIKLFLVWNLNINWCEWLSPPFFFFGLFRYTSAHYRLYLYQLMLAIYSKENCVILVLRMCQSSSSPSIG